MKLMIRFADQIVGALIIIAVGILVFVIFMLGSSQRWFIRDNDYVTYFSSASGLSQNMPVLYKGFTIGRVKSIKFNLADDRVDVEFSIFREYIDKVKLGSRIDLLSSPISALGGNQFLFYPGLGLEKDPLPSGTLIPPANAPESMNLPDKHLTTAPPKDDGIGNIINQVGITLGKLNEALGEGRDENKLADILNNVVGVLAELQLLVGNLSGNLDVEKIMGDLTPALANFRELTEKFNEPDNAIMSFLNSEGELYGNLDKTLGGAAGSLRELEGTIGDIHTQTPQLAALFGRLLTTLKSASQVLESVKNNPLLKGGIQEQPETRAGGSNPRDNTEF
jgi:phospholipid/cholesterol/gamma-HCH transport system substrate-binding protein